jgi:hypothetical protein
LRELPSREGLQRRGFTRLEADADLFYLLGRKRLVEQSALVPTWVTPAAITAPQMRASSSLFSLFCGARWLFAP